MAKTDQTILDELLHDYEIGPAEHVVSKCIDESCHSYSKVMKICIEELNSKLYRNLV